MKFSHFVGRNHISPQNNKAALSHETSPRKSLETPKAVRKIKSQNAITVPLPSPAGKRKFLGEAVRLVWEPVEAVSLQKEGKTGTK